MPSCSADVGSWRGFHRRHGYHTSKKEWLNLMPSTLLSGIMQEYDMHGPNMMVTAMCASGVASLLTAKMWIDAGLATDVLVLATDLSGTPENIRAFSDLGVLIVDAPAFDACRPFQEGSRGFVGGEATIAMIVSKQPSGSYADHPRRVDVARRVPRHLDKPGPQAGVPCLQGRPREFRCGCFGDHVRECPRAGNEAVRHVRSRGPRHSVPSGQGHLSR